MKELLLKVRDVINKCFFLNVDSYVCTARLCEYDRDRYQESMQGEQPLHSNKGRSLYFISSNTLDYITFSNSTNHVKVGIPV